MNKFVRAIKDLDIDAIREMIKTQPKWIGWSEPDGKTRFIICAVSVFGATRKKRKRACKF